MVRDSLQPTFRSGLVLGLMSGIAIGGGVGVGRGNALGLVMAGLGLAVFVYMFNTYNRC